MNGAPTVAHTPAGRSPAVRPAVRADQPGCRGLQAVLPERAPTLLGADVGDHLVVGPRGAPVGYVLAVGDGGRDVATGEVHVAELVVAPGARRQGVGGALLDAVVPHDGAATTLVAPDNDAALALYRSRGFERVGRRPDAFDDGPALLLRRSPGRRS